MEKLLRESLPNIIKSAAVGQRGCAGGAALGYYACDEEFEAVVAASETTWAAWPRGTAAVMDTATVNVTASA